jgi:hypothetical protein
MFPIDGGGGSSAIKFQRAAPSVQPTRTVQIIKQATYAGGAYSGPGFGPKQSFSLAFEIKGSPACFNVMFANGKATGIDLHPNGAPGAAANYSRPLTPEERVALKQVVARDYASAKANASRAPAPDTFALDASSVIAANGLQGAAQIAGLGAGASRGQVTAALERQAALPGYVQSQQQAAQALSAGLAALGG